MVTKNKKPEVRYKEFTEDWIEKEFESLFNKVSNNSLSRDKLNYNAGNAKNIHYGDILVKYNEVLDGKNEVIPYVTDNEIVEKLKSSKLIEGDIIMSDAAEDETVGKCVEITNIKNQIILAGLHTIALRPKENFASKYLGYYLNSNAYHNQLLKLMQGTKVLSISKTSIKNTKVCYPKRKSEQKKIGTFFQNLDNLITQHQKKHEKLVILKKAMLDKMFPKNGSKVPEIRFKGFTGEWEDKIIDDFGKILTGSTPSTQNKGYYSKNGIPWVTPTDIKDSITLLTERHLTKEGKSVARIIPKNSILVTCIASIGKNTILGTEGSCNQQINAVVPNKNIYNPYFLFILSNHWSNYMKKRASSGTMQIVNKDEFSKIKTSSPGITEQTKIGNYFKNLDKQINLHQTQLEKLKNIKNACLSKMFVA